RLFQMARWIQSVITSPTAVWWLVSRGSIHAQLHERLSWTLDTSPATFHPVIRQAWRLALEACAPTMERLGDGWWGVQAQIKKEGWTTQTLRRFASATQPRLTVQRPPLRAPVPPTEDTKIDLFNIGHFEVRYPTLLENTHAVPDRNLAAVL